MNMQRHHVVDCTPGQRPRVLIWSLTDNAEIKRIVGIYRQSQPHATICAVLASDFDAMVRAAGFAD